MHINRYDLHEFCEIQLNSPRVKKAFESKDAILQSLFESLNLVYPPKEIFFRVFKLEQILELFAKDENNKFVLIKQFPICAISGTLGPKRRDGDQQIPEGCYHIIRFNPLSKFHLSLGINYPNDSDYVLSDKDYPGSEIFIHGNCVTVGCIPITDDLIEYLFICAILTRCNGQDMIPVHIYPTHLNEDNYHALLERYHSFPNINSLKELWFDLKEIYQYFEKFKKIPEFIINEEGRYIIKE